MFFRPATQTEILFEIPKESSEKEAQYFVLENHHGVLGLVCFQEYRITIIHSKEEHYLKFLAMIEEFLFMKYPSIILLNPLENIDLQEYQWEKHHQGFIKKKSSMSNRGYSMVVPQKMELL